MVKKSISGRWLKYIHNLWRIQMNADVLIIYDKVLSKSNVFGNPKWEKPQLHYLYQFASHCF